MGDRVFNEALVEPNGWLEFTGEQNLDSFQGTTPLPDSTLQAIQSNLASLYAQLRQRHITLVVVIAPNKASLYPDKLPAALQPLQAQSDLDRLVAALQQNGPPVLVDLRPGLRAARLEHEVYFQTDTHWNAYGAYAAYAAILGALAPVYPQLAPRGYADFNIAPTAPEARDIPRLMSATDILEPGYALAPNPSVNWIIHNDDRIPMRVAYTQQPAAPKLLMYVDSFGEALMPFLAPQFRQATFIENVSLYSDLLTYKEVETASPDIVIVEIVERYLPNLNKWLANYGLRAN